MEERLLRLKDIIGDKNAGIAPIVPVSKSTWWAGVASNRYPQPVRHLGPRITAWRASEIYALVCREV
ncbi:AlpA family phage regulatory protein [Candidatus Nomurabacteria bacterium]|nr:AlpA family phage regulatory protein [Candidatus Nomurabacteria bacterium]